MKLLSSSTCLWCMTWTSARAFSRAFVRAATTASGGAAVAAGGSSLARHPTADQCRRSLTQRSMTASTSTTTTMAADEGITTTTPSSTSTTTTTKNAFLQHHDLPQFQSVDPHDLTPAVERLLEQLERDFANLESELSEQQTNKEVGVVVDYDQVLPVLEQMQHPIGYAWSLASHLNGVKNTDELRQAYEVNEPKIVQSTSKLTQSKAVFDALSIIDTQLEANIDDDATSNSSNNLFEQSQRRRAVKGSLQAMTLGGVGLDGPAKERFNEIKMKLASLSTTFANHVLDDTKTYSRTIADASILEGVPPSAKALWANAHARHLAAESNKKEEGEEEDKDAGATSSPPSSAAAVVDPEAGPWRITLDMPSYLAVMQHVRDRSVREEVYKVYVTRASSGDRDNVPLIYEILQLKQEQAHLLGHANYASLSLSRKMAPSMTAVSELTDLIAAQALPAAQVELEEITALARTEGGPDYAPDALEKLMPWDITFWSERLRESKFELTDEETRPYFALHDVLDGLFALTKRLFNVEVRAADGEAQVWHDDVRFFKLYDLDTGKHMASFFLDPYARPADKRGGAWMADCIGKSAALQCDIPVAYLTCNGSPPVGDTPSLLTYNEATTLFHEFGHGAQHMLTKATVGDVAGINGIEWDAVELPSQFMENWLYDRATVFGFAKHYETGEPLPEDMFDKLCAQKTFNAGMMQCRQLSFGQMDLELHAGFDAAAGAKGDGESVFDLQRRIASKYTPFNMPLPEDRFLCSFQHIFAGGYAAGYYSYLWAEVMSADAFSAFEEVGLQNDEEIKVVGKKFRNTVLAYGGGVPPMEVFKEFRGREPNPDALISHKGFA